MDILCFWRRCRWAATLARSRLTRAQQHASQLGWLVKYVITVQTVSWFGHVRDHPAKATV
jgi:hypothetical protein